MALSKKEKLEMCLKVYRIFKPMSVLSDKFIKALPEGITIDYPFDEWGFLEEILLIITDVKIDRMTESISSDFFNDNYSEEDFIADITEFLDEHSNEEE